MIYTKSNQSPKESLRAKSRNKDSISLSKSMPLSPCLSWCTATSSVRKWVSTRWRRSTGWLFTSSWKTLPARFLSNSISWSQSWGQGSCGICSSSNLRLFRVIHLTQLWWRRWTQRWTPKLRVSWGNSKRWNYSILKIKISIRIKACHLGLPADSPFSRLRKRKTPTRLTQSSQWDSVWTSMSSSMWSSKSKTNFTSRVTRWFWAPVASTLKLCSTLSISSERSLILCINSKVRTSSEWSGLAECQKCFSTASSSICIQIISTSASKVSSSSSSFLSTQTTSWSLASSKSARGTLRHS